MQNKDLAMQPLGEPHRKPSSASALHRFLQHAFRKTAFSSPRDALGTPRVHLLCKASSKYFGKNDLFSLDLGPYLSYSVKP